MTWKHSFMRRSVSHKQKLRSINQTHPNFLNTNQPLQRNSISCSSVRPFNTRISSVWKFEVTHRPSQRLVKHLLLIFKNFADCLLQIFAFIQKKNSSANLVSLKNHPIRNLFIQRCWAFRFEYWKRAYDFNARLHLMNVTASDLSQTVVLSQRCAGDYSKITYLRNNRNVRLQSRLRLHVSLKNI